MAAYVAAGAAGFGLGSRAVSPRRRRRSRVAANARDFVAAWRRLRSVAPADARTPRPAIGPPMKITRLTTFIVPPRWCFLKIETDEGITGWGEPVLEGRAHTVAAAVEELADYLDRQGSRADRGPLDGAVSRRLLSRRRRAHERPRRHRPGAVGHQGQGARRAGARSCSAARCAIGSASIRGSAATGRRTPRPWRAKCGARGFSAVKMNAHRGAAVSSTSHDEGRRGAVARVAGDPRGGGPALRHRRRLPRPRAPADGEGAREGARAVPA